MTDKTILTRRYESPCGTLTLGSRGDALCLCDWADARHTARIRARLRRLLGAEFCEGTSAVIDTAAAQLDEYFAGTRRGFDVPLLLAGTDFQKAVWQSLVAVPYGTTVTYGEFARIIGLPDAVRAVANANGANVLSIFVPCHRVIGAGGRLTGYAGGLPAKEYLLRLESTHCW